MERLTSNTDDISYLCNYLNRHSNFDGDRFKAIHKKLAEYEDLGMTPFEIKSFLKDFGISLSMENRELKKRLKSVKIRMVNQFDGYCPNCNELLIMGSRKYRYCYVCGHLLDWGND